MNGKQLFDAALALVEAKSVRDWATSDHNRPIFLKLANDWAATHVEPLRFATYIVALYLG